MKYDGSIDNVDPEIIDRMKARLEETEFQDYFFEFYGPKGIYPQTIPGLTAEQFHAAYALYRCSGNVFESDSCDREKIRDIILQASC